MVDDGSPRFQPWVINKTKGSRKAKMFRYRGVNILIMTEMFLLLLFPQSLVAKESQWEKVEIHANHEVVQAQRDAAETETIIKKEKERLLGELAELKNRVGKKEKNLDVLKQRFDDLREKEDKMRGELDAQKEEIHTLEGAVMGATKDFDKILRNSLVAPEYVEQAKQVERLATSDEFPSYKDIQVLVDSLFSYMEATGEIVKKSQKLIGQDGKETKGKVVRIGDFMALYRSGSHVGCLKYDPGSDFLIAYPGKLPWLIRRSFKKYIEGSIDHVPLDLSHGAIFKELTVNRGIMEWLESGGFLVWPILLIGAIAIVLIADRLIFLSRLKKDSSSVIEQVNRLISEARFNDCKNICQKYVKIPLCRVIEAGLSNMCASKDVIENALQEAILGELPRVEKFLSTLNVLAAIAPLLGLLGTVTGIINTFQVITRFGTSDPRMMSGGISEALVTTQLGLGVAIPILIMHHFLERKAEKIIDEMEEKGTALTVALLKVRDKGTRVSDVTP